MRDVHQCSKVDFLFVSLCFQNNLFFAVNFVQLPCWNCFELLPFLATASFASGTFIAWGIGINLCTNLQWVNELYPLPAMWSSWSFGRDDSNRFSWTHEPPRCMHVLFFFFKKKNLVGIITLCFSFLMPRSVSSFLFCKAPPPALELPTFSLRLWLFLYFHHLPDRWNKCLPVFAHYRAVASRLPTLAFLSSERLFPFLDQTSGHKYSGLVVAWFFC